MSTEGLREPADPAKYAQEASRPGRPGPILSRRSMLHRMSAGFGLAGLAAMLGPHAVSAADAARFPHFRPRAKRVIFLFLNGGPSHIDTFDPKPALRTHEGRQPEGELYKKSKGLGFFPSSLQFRRHGQSGIEVSESLPHLASVIDECCVIRSMHTDVPNHEPALLQMHSGNLQPIRPSLGSWVLYGLGSANDNLPGYVVLRPSPKIVVGPALWSSGFLPAEFQATSVVTSDMAVDRLVANIRNPLLPPGEQRQQLDLLGRMNRRHLERRDGDAELEAQIRAMETAFRMQREALRCFDISREPESVRRMYGESTFAKSCLLGRRLLEEGVRFVTVYYTSDRDNQPWDTHTDHEQRHRQLCLDGDQAAAALIRDLRDRGMLEDTLVIWGGEFGRTPYAENQDRKKLGRDHHHTAFSMLLAGGGVKGGVVHGASDEFGMRATVDPVHVHDLHATLLHLLGLDHERLTYRYAGRDFRLTDVHGKVVKGILA